MMLRFYEQSGLVRPARTPAGYRTYDDTHIELLSFIGRAKGFGLSLDEITELLTLLVMTSARPSRDASVIWSTPRSPTRRPRSPSSRGLPPELRRVAATLGTHTPAGPCDNACGCTTDEPNGAHPLVLVRPRRRDSPAIACTLSAHEVGDRLAQWEAAVADATGRETIDGGTRLTFNRDVDVTALGSLVAAEQDCCRSSSRSRSPSPPTRSPWT